MTTSYDAPDYVAGTSKIFGLPSRDAVPYYNIRRLRKIVGDNTNQDTTRIIKSLNGKLWSKEIRKQTIITINNTLKKSALMSGSETWGIIEK